MQAGRKEKEKVVHHVPPFLEDLSVHLLRHLEERQVKENLVQVGVLSSV